MPRLSRSQTVRYPAHGGAASLRSTRYLSCRRWWARPRGTIEAYDAASGKAAFRIEVGDAIRFQPALVGGRAFVGTGGGSLIAVTTGDADLDRWTMWGGARHDGGD
jgi:hypothetical protein